MERQQEAIQANQYVKQLTAKANGLWAGWMDRHWNMMGRRSQFLAFGFFVALSATGCLVLILTGGYGNWQKIRPDPIKAVRIPEDTDAALNKTGLLESITAFEGYLDSLSRSEAGRRTRDSILEARPGILDSIGLVKLLYNK